MTNKAIISTEKAPAAIGPYSQAVKVNNTVYLSGQIPLIPDTMEIIEGDITAQATQVFKNLQSVCEAADGDFSKVVKLTIYLTDLGHFPKVNDVMAEFFSEPYPARATVEVSKLPKDVMVEADAIMVI